MGRIAAILLSLFLFATLASAQVPASGNVSFGYSYDNTNLSNISRSTDGKARQKARYSLPAESWPTSVAFAPRRTR